MQVLESTERGDLSVHRLRAFAQYLFNGLVTFSQTPVDNKLPQVQCILLRHRGYRFVEQNNHFVLNVARYVRLLDGGGQVELPQDTGLAVFGYG